MRRIKLMFIIILGLITFTACNGGAKETTDNDTLQVITSFTLIEDMVKQIGGDFVETHNLVPIGTDPHEYDPLPEDIKVATDADIIFYNGFNLEGNEEGRSEERRVGKEGRCECWR